MKKPSHTDIKFMGHVWVILLQGYGDRRLQWAATHSSGPSWSGYRHDTQLWASLRMFSIPQTPVLLYFFFFVSSYYGFCKPLNFKSSGHISLIHGYILGRLAFDALGVLNCFNFQCLGKDRSTQPLQKLGSQRHCFHMIERGQASLLPFSLGNPLWPLSGICTEPLSTGNSLLLLQVNCPVCLESKESSLSACIPSNKSLDAGKDREKL